MVALNPASSLEGRLRHSAIDVFYHPAPVSFELSFPLQWQESVPHLTREALESVLPQYGFLDGKDRLTDNLVFAAIAQAEKSHAGQLRVDSGANYCEEHVFPVAVGVAEYLSKNPRVAANAQPYEVVAAALLHDTLEDDKQMTVSQLASFSAGVAHMVLELSKWEVLAHKQDKGYVRQKQEMLAQYFARLERAPPETKLVKVVDRMNNLATGVQRSLAWRTGYYEETFENIRGLAREVPGLYEPLGRATRRLLHAEEQHL